MEDEEDAGQWWRHIKNNEHKGGRSNQVVTKFYQKQHVLFVYTFPFYRGRRLLRRNVASLPFPRSTVTHHDTSLFLYVCFVTVAG